MIHKQHANDKTRKNILHMTAIVHAGMTWAQQTGGQVLKGVLIPKQVNL